MWNFHDPSFGAITDLFLTTRLTLNTITTALTSTAKTSPVNYYYLRSPCYYPPVRILAPFTLPPNPQSLLN